MRFPSIPPYISLSALCIGGISGAVILPTGRLPLKVCSSNPHSAGFTTLVNSGRVASFCGNSSLSFYTAASLYNGSYHDAATANRAVLSFSGSPTAFANSAPSVAPFETTVSRSNFSLVLSNLSALNASKTSSSGDGSFISAKPFSPHSNETLTASSLAVTGTAHSAPAVNCMSISKSSSELTATGTLSSLALTGTVQSTQRGGYFEEPTFNSRDSASNKATITPISVHTGDEPTATTVVSNGHSMLLIRSYATGCTQTSSYGFLNTVLQSTNSQMQVATTSVTNMFIDGCWMFWLRDIPQSDLIVPIVLGADFSTIDPHDSPCAGFWAWIVCWIKKKGDVNGGLAFQHPQPPIPPRPPDPKSPPVYQLPDPNKPPDAPENKPEEDPDNRPSASKPLETAPKSVPSAPSSTPTSPTSSSSISIPPIQEATVTLNEVPSDVPVGSEGAFYTLDPASIFDAYAFGNVTYTHDPAHTSSIDLGPWSILAAGGTLISDLNSTIAARSSIIPISASHTSSTGDGSNLSKGDSDLSSTRTIAASSKPIGDLSSTIKPAVSPSPSPIAPSKPAQTFTFLVRTLESSILDKYTYTDSLYKQSSTTWPDPCLPDTAVFASNPSHSVNVLMDIPFSLPYMSGGQSIQCAFQGGNSYRGIACGNVQGRCRDVSKADEEQGAGRRVCPPAVGAVGMGPALSGRIWYARTVCVMEIRL